MSKIVLEDFNEGEGYYKVFLAYLTKEQVGEIEALVSRWGPNDEDIKNCIGMCLTDASEQRFKDYGTNLRDCLAWLENQKQTADKPIWKYKKDSNPLIHDSLILNKYGCVAKSPSGAIVSDVWVLDYEELAKLPKEKIKKQGEQKDINPTLPEKEKMDNVNKVEPKFEIEKGKWYVCNTSRYTDFIIGKAYYCPKNGMLKPNENEIARYVARDCFHPWTIEDAKEGDILANKTNDVILIFKSIRDNDFFYSYCDYLVNTFRETQFTLWANFSFIPATKEQCEYLFAKMREAGYEWDAEKKMLKKIIQNTDKVEPKFKVGDTMRTLQEANDGYTDGMPVVISIDNEYYHCTNELIAIKDQDDYEFPPINVKQKHNDIKFKYGDWITDGKHTRLVIDGLSPLNYTLLEQDGNILSGTIENIEHTHHLWTINDAKDGDVLCCESGWTCIFKALNSDISFSSYCFMDYTEWFCETGSESHTLDKTFIKAYNGNIYPATKEQRDLLFRKMKEAGYMWDAEKKKLMKSIQKHNDKTKFKVGDWITDGRVTRQITDIDSDYYWYSENHPLGHVIGVDKTFHLWTISDARDGDVLVTTFDEDNMIVMYHSMCTIDTINVHCCLDNKFVCRNLGVFDAEDVKPATNEQRDILFEKMHEAGYVWDAESKQLLSLKAEPTAKNKYLELENERIRKDLIEWIEDFPDSVWRGHHKKNIIAWLEKSKWSKEKLYEHIMNTCACIDYAMCSESIADRTNYLQQASYDANKAFEIITEEIKGNRTC